jgi:2,4-dienoyl-CoA reductase-like NADH-dependent reductase (Old Yellow Enzyme family)
VIFIKKQGCVSMTSLNQAFKEKSLELRNRWVMAPMTRSFSPGGIPTKEVTEYYVKRAKGGVGLIITEGVGIDHSSSVGYPDVPVMSSNSMEAWRDLVKEVHSVGGKIIPQLWHVGSCREAKFDLDNKVPCLGPSAVVHPALAQAGRELVAKEMTKEGMDEIKAGFVRSAQIAKSVGFDGIEIHGAHGYLLDQFLWEATNLRTDEYGGTFKNRARFPYEVVEAIREAVGKDFPIIYRFSQWKLGDFDYKFCQTAQDLETFLVPLTDAGVDIFHASTRRFWEPEFEDSELNLAGWVKKITDYPVITVGSIGLTNDFISLRMGEKCENNSVDELEERFKKGEFDLAAVGRALISDPEWVNKIESGDKEVNLFHLNDLHELK